MISKVKCAGSKEAAMNHSIKPGKPWMDTNGNRIQAHGGAIFYENDTYYWYGENKEKTDGKNKIWTWGVRCYSSKDLYNWTDEGLIIEPVTDDKKSHLHPNNYLDRPHILKNEKTGKYVCWLKFSGKIGCFGIMTADHLMGPYTMVRDDFRPYGKGVGDFDLAVDEETKKAYVYFEYEHHGVAAMELTEDYIGVTGAPVLLYEGLKPPFTREGVTLFTRNGLHYLLTSGMTGYIPNPSEVATFHEWKGKIEIQGNPHRNDESLASFNSQVSAVFRHPKKEDLYIVLADRWVPDYIVTRERYEWLKRVIASNYDKSYKAGILEKLKLAKTPMLGSANTSVSDYVWLPMRFEGDRAVIEWRDEWTVDDNDLC